MRHHHGRVKRLLNQAVHAGWRWVSRAGRDRAGHQGRRGVRLLRRGQLHRLPARDHPQPRAGSTSAPGTLVGPHSTLSVGYGVGDPRIDERILIIGDRCVLGTRTTITAHERIEIGDAVFFGQNVFVTDASHGYQDPGVPIGRQWGPHQPVSIGAGTWVGHGAVILPGARIGRNVVVAAGCRRPRRRSRTSRSSPAARRASSGASSPGVGWVGSTDVRPVIDQATFLAPRAEREQRHPLG